MAKKREVSALIVGAKKKEVSVLIVYGQKKEVSALVVCGQKIRSICTDCWWALGQLETQAALRGFFRL